MHHCARKTHCPSGHPYAGDNLRIVSTTGRRKCRLCTSARAAKQLREGKIHPLYFTWKQMRQRCNNPRHKKFKYYGALGVTLCERWQSFESFAADMGKRPAGTSIDRIDPWGNYEPGNCRWATPMEQTHNRRADASPINALHETED